MAHSSITTESPNCPTFAKEQPLINPLPKKNHSDFRKAYLSNPRALQFWSSAMVVLPVFLQAPWVRLHPFSACLFTSVILGVGISLVEIGGKKWAKAGSLLVGVSGSWLGGCLFWGWLRAHPMWHMPIEAFALPLAIGGLTTRWRIGSSFYLACLVGTAFTDLMMVLTGVMDQWPAVVEAPLQKAPAILHQTAELLLAPQALILLFIAGGLIVLIARAMQHRASLSIDGDNPWLVASAALTTTLWIDGLFLLTALLQPKLSGLI